MARVSKQKRVIANIGDVIESLEVMREAIGELRGLPQTVALAALRGSTSQEIADIVKQEISAFLLVLTPEKADE